MDEDHSSPQPGLSEDADSSGEEMNGGLRTRTTVMVTRVFEVGGCGCRQPEFRTQVVKIGVAWLGNREGGRVTVVAWRGKRKKGRRLTSPGLGL